MTSRLLKKWEAVEVELPAGATFKKTKNNKHIYSYKQMNKFWIVYASSNAGYWIIEEYSGYCPC